MTQAILNLEGNRMRDQGIAQVDSHTPEAWKTSMDTAISTYAKTGRTFTAEDVREIAGEPPTPNAMGARFLQAMKRGIISKVGYRSAHRSSAHGRAIAVYTGVL